MRAEPPRHTQLASSVDMYQRLRIGDSAQFTRLSHAALTSLVHTCPPLSTELGPRQHGTRSFVHVRAFNVGDEAHRWTLSTAVLLPRAHPSAARVGPKTRCASDRQSRVIRPWSAPDGTLREESYFVASAGASCSYFRSTRARWRVARQDDVQSGGGALMAADSSE